MVHVSLSVYDPKGTYSRHAGVVMASVLRNTDEQVCFHILHDETLTEENRRKLEETVLASPSKSSVKRHGTVKFIDVSHSMEKLAGVDFDEICGRFSRGTLYRLMIPEIMPGGVERLIYLDCDIVAALDIASLWQTVLKDDTRTFAGVLESRSSILPEEAARKNEITVDKMGLSKARYINAGVLSMNIAKLRSERPAKQPLFHRAAAYIERFNPPLLDQDFLNAEYLCDIRYLDPKYNTDPGDKVYEDIFGMERIGHFGGHLKPWDALTGTNADMLYWQYLSYTPWRGELWGSLFKAASNEKYYHRHSKGCVKRLQSQTWDNVKNIFKV